MRVIYRTTWIEATQSNPDGPARQDVFIKALKEAGCVDWVEFGLDVPKVKVRPLALPDRRGKPVLVTAQPPILVKAADDTKVPDAFFYVSVADRQENRGLGFLFALTRGLTANSLS